jgi:hypothetical protein
VFAELLTVLHFSSCRSNGAFTCMFTELPCARIALVVAIRCTALHHLLRAVLLIQQLRIYICVICNSASGLTTASRCVTHVLYHTVCFDCSSLSGSLSENTESTDGTFTSGNIQELSPSSAATSASPGTAASAAAGTAASGTAAAAGATAATAVATAVATAAVSGLAALGDKRASFRQTGRCYRRILNGMKVTSLDR